MNSNDCRSIAVGLHVLILALGIVMVALEFLPVEAPVHELSFLL